MLGRGASVVEWPAYDDAPREHVGRVVHRVDSCAGRSVDRHTKQRTRCASAIISEHSLTHYLTLLTQPSGPTPRRRAARQPTAARLAVRARGRVGVPRPASRRTGDENNRQHTTHAFNRTKRPGLPHHCIYGRAWGHVSGACPL